MSQVFIVKYVMIELKIKRYNFADVFARYGPMAKNLGKQEESDNGSEDVKLNRDTKQWKN